MKTRAELMRLSDATDFRPEVLEKVHRLLAILNRLDDDPAAKNQALDITARCVGSARKA